MAWAVWFIQAAVMVAVIRLRFAPEQLRWASPWAWPTWAWWPVAGGLAALACVAMLLDRRRWRSAKARRAMGQTLVVFVPATAYVWGLSPLRGLNWVGGVVLGGVFTAAMVMVLVEPGSMESKGLTRKHFGRACKALAVPTAMMVATPVVLAWLWAGTQFTWERLGVSAATYPLYALVQLLVFQVFLVRRLRAMAGSSASASVGVVAAGMFATAHWPNPVVMLACFVGALVWTAVYLKWPNVVALAISMGLAATSLGVALPRDPVTRNLRTGPIYIYRMGQDEATRPDGVRPWWKGVERTGEGATTSPG